MIHIKYLLFFSLLCICLWPYAQSKHLVKNIDATYIVHLPGNIAADRNGNSISRADTVNIIYVETTTRQIHWTHAWKDGKDYSVNSSLLTGLTFDAGTNKKTNEKMILHSAKGNKLWRLQLVPGRNFFLAPFKTAQGEMILWGMYHSKKITQKIAMQTEIISIPPV